MASWAATWPGMPVVATHRDPTAGDRGLQRKLRHKAWMGDTKAVVQLLSKGADVDKRDEDGFTALLIASRWGRLDLVRYLVEQAGADIAAVEKSAGLSAYGLAASQGFEEVADYLASKGCATTAAKPSAAMVRATSADDWLRCALASYDEDAPPKARAPPPARTPASRSSAGAIPEAVPPEVRWEIGEIVDVETDEGIEQMVEVLGPAVEGDMHEMRVRFSDGVVDDWPTLDFRKRTATTRGCGVAGSSAASAQAVATASEASPSTGKAVQAAAVAAAARSTSWVAGEIIGVDTEDGMEWGVRVLGPAESASPAEMQVRFTDGSVDDWPVEDFRKTLGDEAVVEVRA